MDSTSISFHLNVFRITKLTIVASKSNYEKSRPSYFFVLVAKRMHKPGNKCPNNTHEHYKYQFRHVNYQNKIKLSYKKMLQFSWLTIYSSRLRNRLLHSIMQTRDIKHFRFVSLYFLLFTNVCAYTMRYTLL